MPDVIIPGPAGRIEGKYFQAKNPTAPIALVLHPHPLHGGNMNNKVTYRMYETLARSGFTVLRFNFRGVGNSEGVFDHGSGELADAAACLDWLHAQNPGASHIWLTGFSFGAWIMLQLLMRRPDVHRFLAVSPPAGMYDFSFFSPIPNKGLITVGTNDEITPHRDIEDWLKKTPRQKGINIKYATVNGADHFYTGQLDDLSQLMMRYAMTEIPELAPKKQPAA